jgi:DNA-binding CsgD family transcriptional regulator/outer membrane protein assembly factor BamD (BamD/ComL family)
MLADEVSASMPALRPAEYLAGDDALARGAWEEARNAFESVLSSRESPEALEGLGDAAWWLDLADLVFDSRERAYRLYLERGDSSDAARVAVWLAWDYWAFRGEGAVANGWLRRSRRLLKGQPANRERAWLEIREGSLCLLEEGDPLRALALARAGIRIARKVKSIDLEMLGRAVEGLSLVVSGRVAEGMCNLDEVNAAVIAGELTDRVAIGLSGCYLIAACERVRDCDRAAQWCNRLKEFCSKWGLRPLLAVCRTQYASICLWRGTWSEAEMELCTASVELAASRPGMTGEALVRLAELRRRQGRLAEAATLFEQLPPRGQALLGRAELALDSSDPQAAAEQAERYLRHIPTQNRTDRAAGLELLVRALTDLKRWDRAKAAIDELVEIAALVATTPLRASASFALGYVELGNGKAEAARGYFEDALDLYRRSGAPFEVGRAHTQLACALSKLGRIKAAIDEAEHAVAAFSELKAEMETSRARDALDRLSRLQSAENAQVLPAGENGGLSRRELEVLRLVAEGLNNQSIAKRLFVSDHTVHRHLANILSKMDVSSRAAAVAKASRRGLLS